MNVVDGAWPLLVLQSADAKEQTMQETTRAALNELLANAGWGDASVRARAWWSRLERAAEEARRPDWLALLLIDVIAHGRTLNDVADACEVARLEAATAP